MKFSLNIFYSLLGKKGHRVGEQMPEDLENSFFQKRAELKEKDRVTKIITPPQTADGVRICALGVL